ncbi:MAG: hypothetical protein EXQ53_04740 [Acidobacteria bacterium]|nr:hypothetical protein [Acidobacteriota bacterium]
MIGSYQLLDRNGVGGMGEVWKARDRLLQIGERDGDSYLAMEFVEGESLRRRIGASHDRSEAIEISEQIVDGRVRFTYKDYLAAPRTRRPPS